MAGNSKSRRGRRGGGRNSNRNSGSGCRIAAAAAADCRSYRGGAASAVAAAAGTATVAATVAAVATAGPQRRRRLLPAFTGRARVRRASASCPDAQSRTRSSALDLSAELTERDSVDLSFQSAAELRRRSAPRAACVSGLRRRSSASQVVLLLLTRLTGCALTSLPLTGSCLASPPPPQRFQQLKLDLALRYSSCTKDESSVTLKSPQKTLV